MNSLCNKLLLAGTHGEVSEPVKRKFLLRIHFASLCLDISVGKLTSTAIV